MKRPLFSCVMPVKGPRPFMDEALASLSAQGMGDDLEVIIQDSGFGQRGMRFERVPDYLWAQRRWEGSKTQRRIDADESRQQWREIDGMLQKNGFRVTVGGICRLRLWRMLCGCYLRELKDACRLRGRGLHEFA